MPASAQNQIFSLYPPQVDERIAHLVAAVLMLTGLLGDILKSGPREVKDHHSRAVRRAVLTSARTSRLIWSLTIESSTVIGITALVDHADGL